MQTSKILAKQYGLIVRRQALDCGLTRRTIDTLLATGAWIRVGRCVYRDATHPVTDRQQALAGVLLAGDEAVLSEDSAPWLWGVSGWDLHPIHLTVPYPRHPVVPSANVHRSHDLGRLDRTTFLGIPVTTPARTLIDIADRPLATVEDCVDEFLCGVCFRSATSPAGRGRSPPPAGPARPTY